jgi:hypothetical protein
VFSSSSWVRRSAGLSAETEGDSAALPESDALDGDMWCEYENEVSIGGADVAIVPGSIGSETLRWNKGMRDVGRSGAALRSGVKHSQRLNAEY